jgi:hypothetical protein
MFNDEEVDRRIRDGLNRSAQGVDANAAVLLGEATGRGHRAVRKRRQVRVLSCVTVVVALAALAVAPLTLSRHTREQPAEPVHISRLAGSFARTIPQGGGVVQTGHLAGRWTLRFSQRGTARVQAPPTFEGISSGVSFLEHADGIRIDIFVQDLCAGQPVGSYQWVNESNTLRFTNVDDTCAARIGLLSGGSWRHVS